MAVEEGMLGTAVNPGLGAEILRAAAPWHNQVRQKLRQSAASRPIAHTTPIYPHEKG
jgi:hypothetical protein